MPDPSFSAVLLLSVEVVQPHTDVSGVGSNRSLSTHIKQSSPLNKIHTHVKGSSFPEVKKGGGGVQVGREMEEGVRERENNENGINGSDKLMSKI